MALGLNGSITQLYAAVCLLCFVEKIVILFAQFTMCF
jgi:hypothetical protein